MIIETNNILLINVLMEKQAISFVGMGKNIGMPVHCSISLVWYVPQHTCPYCSIHVFLFLVTENLKSLKYRHT